MAIKISHYLALQDLVKHSPWPILFLNSASSNDHGHNKTLAAQIYGEMKSFFDNDIGYFVSFYDYYQPEAYVAKTDAYIEKDSSINEQIDRLRHSATRSFLKVEIQLL